MTCAQDTRISTWATLRKRGQDKTYWGRYFGCESNYARTRSTGASARWYYW